MAKKNEEVRILPHNPEAERLVLGTLMTDRKAYADVQEMLTEECFYSPFHADIYRAIKTLESRGDRADVVSVLEELRRANEVDPVRFMEVAEGYTFDLQQHVALLYDKAKRRLFFEIGSFLVSNAYNETEDIADVLNEAGRRLSGIFESPAGSMATLREAIKGVYGQIDRNGAGESFLTGTPTGFGEFDKKSGGLQKSDLIIVAGETGQGKTSFALSVVKYAALAGTRIAMYSLEMKKEQLAARMMAMESGVPANEILYSVVSSRNLERIDRSVKGLFDAHVLFDDRSTSNIDTILASIRTMVLKYGVEGVVIDYLQILNVNMKGVNKEQQMGDVVRRLKNLAKELDIWIIALSQLNRDASCPAPTLARLRDSGQIAEAADIVIFVYRPVYYGKKYPEPFQNYRTEGTAMIDVAKGRNIGLLKFICSFRNEITLFSEFDGRHILEEPVEEEEPF